MIRIFWRLPGFAPVKNHYNCISFQMNRIFINYISLFVGLCVALGTSCSQLPKTTKIPDSGPERKVISTSINGNSSKKVVLAGLVGVAVFGMERVNKSRRTTASLTGASAGMLTAKALIDKTKSGEPRRQRSYQILQARVRDYRNIRQSLIEAAAFNAEVINYVRAVNEEVAKESLNLQVDLESVAADISEVLNLRKQWLLLLKENSNYQIFCRNYRDRINVLERYSFNLEETIRLKWSTSHARAPY